MGINKLRSRWYNGLGLDGPGPPIKTSLVAALVEVSYDMIQN